MGLVAGAAIGAVGAIGSAAIGSSAAGRAADASQQSSDAAIAAQERARSSNQANLTPFLNTGTLAGGQINSLLGLGAQDTDWAAYVQRNPDALEQWQTDPNERAKWGGDVNAFGQFHWSNDGAKRDLSGLSMAEKAFGQFRDSTGYDFRLKQGMDAVNSGYAGAGTVKSGAAMKGINDYGQGMASQEFGNYMNALGNQQGIGLQAGSSIAGVSQNAANSMGQIYQQNGANQANAALLKAQNTGQALNSLANIGGSFLGQSSFGGGVNTNALNAATAAYAPTSQNLYAGQTNDWRSW